METRKLAIDVQLPRYFLPFFELLPPCLLPSASCPELLGRIHRESCVFPRLEATQQCSRVFDTFSFEIDHRTGARVFGRSRTIGNDRFIAR